VFPRNNCIFPGSNNNSCITVPLNINGLTAVGKSAVVTTAIADSTDVTSVCGRERQACFTKLDMPGCLIAKRMSVKIGACRKPWFRKSPMVRQGLPSSVRIRNNPSLRLSCEAEWKCRPFSGGATPTNKTLSGLAVKVCSILARGFPSADIRP